MSKDKRLPGRSAGGVRFSEQTEEIQIPVDENGAPAEQQQPVVRRMKRPRPERPNPDEIDDVDDYVSGDDDDDDNNGGGFNEAVPKEAQTLEAKRQRRLRQHGDDDEHNDGHEEDRETSLASEGIAIEPFNMDEERTDGTGYFDGDTYVFRRGGGGGQGNEEPDAWLDSLNNREKGDEEEENLPRRKQKPRIKGDAGSKRGTIREKMDSWSKEQLYAKLIPLVSDTETVSQAIVRYGKLMKQQQSQPQDAPGEEGSLAKQAMDDLTEAASALLLKGDVSIYQQTRNDLLQLLQQPTDANQDDDGETSKQPSEPVLWEYQGNNDGGQIHGPFTTQQMQGWIQQGYFVGPTAVHVRTVQQQQQQLQSDDDQLHSKKPAAQPQEPASLQDDLLSDLLEDDDEEEEEGNKKKPSSKQEEEQKQEPLRGQWVLSDKVDFRLYQ